MAVSNDKNVYRKLKKKTSSRMTLCGLDQVNRYYKRQDLRNDKRKQILWQTATNNNL